jgi:hypothetical protein
MEINLLKGISDIEFGITKDIFIEKKGAKGAFEIIEEEGELKTEAIYLEEDDCTLYFEGAETEMIFTACETENTKAKLFGEDIFKKSEAEIKQIMADRKFIEIEEDIEEWGEKRLSYYDAMVDFFFEGKKLVSISWGILIL